MADGARRAMAWQADLVRLADTAGRPAAGDGSGPRRARPVGGRPARRPGRIPPRGGSGGTPSGEADLDRIRRTVNGLLVGGAWSRSPGRSGWPCCSAGAISRRLAALAENARRLPAGRELAPEVGGGDEIAQVDRAFRQMAAELRALNQTLEDRVRARTADLDRASAALRVEEGRFRSAFDDTDVAMVLTDLDNRFVRANAAFARMFGYPMDEVLQLTMADVTYPDDSAESYAQRTRLLAGEATFFQMEKRYRHADGRVLWGLTNVSLVRGPPASRSCTSARCRTSPSGGGPSRPSASGPPS